MAVKRLRTSVRELVGFALRSGDLAAGGIGSPERLVEGTRGHQEVQRMRPDGYRAEVAVSHTVESEDLSLEINGRIDGLVAHEPDAVLVEEIKTTYGELDPEAPDNPHHWGQAKVYAYILAVQNDLQAVDVQLTYLQLDSHQTSEDKRRFSLEELSDFFTTLVESYLHWARIHHEWTLVRDRSIKEAAFPFATYRQGQRHLAAGTYRAIVGRYKLYTQAPTGIGKTISTLFPAIKAMGEGHAEKIFYLTAKTIGRTVAEKALDDLRDNGLRFKSLTLTARDKICFGATGGQSCDPTQCEFALGYYDRVNDALEDVFEHDALTRPRIEEYARKHRICPFEFSLDLSLWCDAVICDYNYVFDPKAFLKRFFLDQSGDYVFLIDEAHNLVDRAREMFSAQLHQTAVSGLRRAVKKEHPHLERQLKDIAACFRQMNKRCEEDGEGGGHWTDEQAPQELLAPLRKFLRQAEKALAAKVSPAYEEMLVEFYFEAAAFIRVSDLYDGRYITYGEKEGRDLKVRLFCLDPSHLIGEALKRGAAAVFFSATLTPLPYFRQVLGGSEEDTCLNLQSPFPAEHLRLLLADHIDTSYRGRQHSYDEVAASIAALVNPRRGNYLVFFPSYRYMQEIAERFAAAYPALEAKVQTPGMSETEREDFLAVFNADNPGTVVGFAVMGGIFGEGIDLVGERLVGAAVVGVGLPQVCLERNLIRAYFDARDDDGFTYAYTYPGINRVLQAAGRVIRSDADRGVVLLLDKRFSQSRYAQLLPTHWTPLTRTRSGASVEAETSRFWAETETS
jgi:DNA excision repair protein ERCC-2